MSVMSHFRDYRGIRNVALSLRHPWTFATCVRPYVSSMREYRDKGGSAPWRIISPQLGDATSVQSTDPHYFHQAGWASRHIGRSRPTLHCDVGGQAHFLATLTGISRIVGLEYRPLTNSMPGLTNIQADLLRLPFPDESIASLSCLHVIEHVGLGRYGDSIDPAGTAKAAAELVRVLSPGGRLYVSLPVGRVTRTEFNAHRVHSVDSVLNLFAELALLDFALVDDDGQFTAEREPSNTPHLHHGLGMFAFLRPSKS